MSVMRIKFIGINIVFFIMMFIPVYSYGLCVKVPIANLRSGPGTQYEKVWQVNQYMPFKKVGVSLSGDWYAVRDVDGDVNWIHKSLVTSRYRCAVVKSETVNVRTGPGMIYDKKFLEPMRRYDSFRVLRTKGAWVKVKDEWNNGGWINKNFLWIK
jgi:SH3-like domain-containing protein